MQLRSEETRDRILSTSYQLFLQQGYDTTGVAQICEEAQVSKGAFYHHFPSKHDVFLTLLENWLSELDKRFEQNKQETTNVPDRLMSMTSALSTIFSEADQIPMFLEFWMQSMRDPIVAQKTIAPYYRYIQYLKAILEKGIEEGSIRSESNPKLSSRLIVAFAIGMILQCMIEPHGENWQQMSQYGLETILSGLQKEK